MLRRLIILACCIALLSICQLSYALDKQDSIKKPLWQKGSSWKIKCPVTTYHPNNGKSKAGEYTVNVKVIGTDKAVNDTQCYVLEIAPGDDLPDNMKENSEMIIERVYYAVDTLDLTQIERWQIGKDGKAEKLGREVTSARYPLSAVYYGKTGSWVPLLLPKFPLAQGSSTSQYKHESKQLKSQVEDDSETVLSNEGVVEVETPDSKEISIKGVNVKKLNFYSITDYSKSGEVKKKESEQIWASGKQWWSSAKIYDDDQLATEFTLVE